MPNLEEHIETQRESAGRIRLDREISRVRECHSKTPHKQRSTAHTDLAQNVVKVCGWYQQRLACLHHHGTEYHPRSAREACKIEGAHCSLYCVYAWRVCAVRVVWLNTSSLCGIKGERYSHHRSARICTCDAKNAPVISLCQQMIFLERTTTTLKDREGPWM